MGEVGVEQRELVGNIEQYNHQKNTYLSHKETQSLNIKEMQTCKLCTKAFVYKLCFFFTFTI